MAQYRHDDGGSDVPADPLPREIPVPVDRSALRRNLSTVSAQASELRSAVQHQLASAGTAPVQVTVVSVDRSRGTVRLTDPDGGTLREAWVREPTGWRRRND